MQTEGSVDKSAPLLLGIDGGGTRTTAWLARILTSASEQPKLKVLGKATAGPSNVRSIGFDRALDNVDKATASAFQNAGLPPCPGDAACLGLAGAGRSVERVQVLQRIEQRQLAKSCEVVSDIEALAAAGGDLDAPASTTAPTLALIAGTGSMAWGRNERGQVARAGGWGYLLGDEGSGYWLGRQLLQAACHQQDQQQDRQQDWQQGETHAEKQDEKLSGAAPMSPGLGDRATSDRATPAPLMRVVLEHLELKSIDELVPWCYGSADPRSKIASLAPLLFACRDEHPVLQEIEQRGAAALAEVVVRLRTSLGLDDCDATPLACAGGVLLGQPSYRDQLLSKLAVHSIVSPVVSWVESPVVGALRLAHTLWQRRHHRG